MARIKNGVLGKFSGKVGDQILVNGTKIKSHTREAVEPGTKKNEPAFKKQHQRTKILNKLASSITRVVDAYGEKLKRGGFYRNLHTQFRKAPQDSLYFLLMQLKGIDVNPRYPLVDVSAFNLQVEALKNKISVKFHIHKHPLPGQYKADCYYYEPVLMMWKNKDAEPDVRRMRSEWIPMKKGEPKIEFAFPRAAGVTHWLLLLKVRLGQENAPIESFTTYGMRIVEVGTVNKKELEAWRKHVAEKSVRKGKRAREEDVEVVGVKW